MKATICELKKQIDAIKMENFEIVAKMECFEGEIANMDEKLKVTMLQESRTPARTYRDYIEENPCTPVGSVTLDGSHLRPLKKNGGPTENFPAWSYKTP